MCDDDNSKAVCKVCNDKIPRGGSNLKAFNTTNLRKHLEHHQNKYKEFLAEVEKEKVRAHGRKDEFEVLSQPKIDKSLELLKPYGTESPRYIAITNAMTRMIARLSAFFNSRRRRI